MKTVELRDLAVDELHDKVRELREELFNLRFQLATGQLDNHRRLRLVKREMARVRTVIREHELAVAEEREPASAESASATTTEEAAQ